MCVEVKYYAPKCLRIQHIEFHQSLWLCRYWIVSSFHYWHLLCTSGCDSGFGQALARHLDSIGTNVFAGCLCASSPGASDLLSSCSERYDSLSFQITTVKDVISQNSNFVSKNWKENLKCRNESVTESKNSKTVETIRCMFVGCFILFSRQHSALEAYCFCITGLLWKNFFITETWLKEIRTSWQRILK